MMRQTSGTRLQAAGRRFLSAKAGAGGLSGPKITGVLRFYKDVGVKEVADEAGGATRTLYAVTLDGKTVKTPSRIPLRLPNRSLAYAVAHEWDAQEHSIRPATMPMMTLASTALDLEDKAGAEEIISEMMHYFHTDTVCYQVTADQQDKLAVLQQKKWNPLRKWFAEQFGGDVDVSHGTINPLAHDERTVSNVRDHLAKLNFFELASLRCITKECKSLITAVALFKRHISANEAMELSRVEEEFQIDRWGLVEGGHDLDRVNCRVNVSSASFLLWLLQNKH